MHGKRLFCTKNQEMKRKKGKSLGEDEESEKEKRTERMKRIRGKSLIEDETSHCKIPLKRSKGIREREKN